jgi:DNA-binding beta-propeller fold protein YncE
MAETATAATLYMMPGCGVCVQVKQYLTGAGVPFEVRWLSDAVNLAWVHAWVARDPARTTSAPFLVVGDKVIQGYDPARLDAALRDAGFDPDAVVSNAGRSNEQSPAPTAAWWVTDFEEGCVRFLSAAGEALTASFALGAGSMPIAVAHDPMSDTVAVSDFAGDRIVLFDRRTGSPVNGEVATSSLTVPRQPADIVVDPRRGWFYVACAEGGAVVAIDAHTRDYAGGARESATTATGGATTGSLALDPDLDRVFVRRLADVVAIDLESGATLSAIPAGMGRNVAVDAATHTLYVPNMEGNDHRLAYHDARTGAYVSGDAASSVVVTPDAPFGLAIDAGTRSVFLTSLGPGLLSAFDADRPRRHPDAEELPVPGAARSLAIDMMEHVLAVSRYQDGAVTFVDTSSRRYRHGTLEASTQVVGGALRGAAIVRPAE